MSELVKYEAACRAVADAVSIDEAKAFRDKSEAMRAYARQAKNKQMEAQAAEIRIRAERRIGELMAAQREAGFLKPGNPDGFAAANRSETNPLVKPPTLEEVGIDKKLADRARKYAAIPEPEFNRIVSGWRERVGAENARVTVDLLAAGKKAEAAKPVSREEPAVDLYAEARADLSGLTREGLEDEVIGLRAENAELREKLKAAEADKAALKAKLDEALSADMGRALGNAQRQRDTLKGRLDEKMAENARQARRIRILEGERDEARRKIEQQVVEI